MTDLATPLCEKIDNRQLREGCYAKKPGRGNSVGERDVLAACDDGQVLIYDAKRDAWMQLNKEPNTRKPVAVISRGNRAFLLVYEDGSARRYSLKPGKLRTWVESRLSPIPGTRSPEQ